MPYQTHSPNDRFDIQVKGKASLLLPAERAVLEITISGRDEDKQDISKDVLDDMKAIEAMLRPISGAEGRAVDYWSRTSLSVSSVRKFNRKTHEYEDEVEHTAELFFTVHFRRFQALAQFNAQINELDYVETRPVTWILKDETKMAHQSELRVRAVQNAREQALELAGALGYQKFVPYYLEGVSFSNSIPDRKGIRSHSEVENRPRNLAEAENGDWQDVEDAVFEYQPEDISMTCTVDGHFHAQ